MSLPPYTSLITLLISIYYLWIGIYVGMVRRKVNILAPAVTGDPLLERAIRVQMNALEFAPVIFPGLWLAAMWMSDVWAACLGLVWVVARIAYLRLYMNDPASRGAAFTIQGIAAVVLIIIALTGVASKLLHG